MRSFKQIIIICVLLILLLTGLLIATQAKEYSIKSADFKVQILKNGDAKVTETWTVNFTKGKFTRFYISRYLKLPEAEKFSDIEYHYFMVNDQVCTLNNSNQRTPFTYNIKTTEENETYTWYIDAQNEELIFEVQYTLKDIVKHVNDRKNTPEFCYRFVGKNFEKTIENLTIEIYLPKKCEMEVSSTLYHRQVEGNVAKFSARNFSGLAKVTLSIPKEVFSETLPVAIESEPVSSLPSIDKIGRLLLKILTVCLNIIIITFVFFRPLKDKVTNIQHSHLKELAKDTQLIESILNHFTSLNITPVEYNKIVCGLCTEMNVFRLILLELIRRRIIFFDQNNLHIDITKNSSLKAYENEFLNTLLKIMPFKDQNHEKSISLSEFLNSIINEHLTIAYSMEKIWEMIADILKNIDPFLKDGAITLAAYLEQRSAKFPCNTFEVLQYYENNQSIDLIALYYFATISTTSNLKALSEFKPVEHVTMHEFYYTLACLLEAAAPKSNPYASFSSDSAFGCSVSSGCGGGGAGCSGCSGCSGCGGGGAD